LLAKGSCCCVCVCVPYGEVRSEWIHLPYSLTTVINCNELAHTFTCTAKPTTQSICCGHFRACHVFVSCLYLRSSLNVGNVAAESRGEITALPAAGGPCCCCCSAVAPGSDEAELLLKLRGCQY
jgi:hypothetical protein